jgi:hypothetical protein
MKIKTQILAKDVPEKRRVQKIDRSRLIALLKENCLTHSEIAKRVGLSRERVRQLANKLIGQTGQERHAICTFNRRQARFDSHPFTIKARSLGLDIYWESFRKVWVNGVFCSMSIACMHGFNNQYVNIYRPSGQVDVFIFRLPDGRFLFLPFELGPRKQTSFKLEDKDEHKVGYTYSTAHYYRDYIEAWHIFDAGQSASANRNDSGTSEGISLG